MNRIYTLFLLPNGDRIPLSWRNEKSLNEYIKRHPNFKLLGRSNKPLINIRLNSNDIHRLMDLFYSLYPDEECCI